jgi:hypothetical protein
MKKNEVKVGGSYLAKVSDKVVAVRITGENPRGGWDATNEATGKAVRIKSAQRLRSAVHKSRPLAVATPPQADAGGSALAEDKLSDGAKKALAGARAKAAAPDTKLDADVEADKKARTEKKAKAAKPKGERKPGLVALAVEVLRETKTPMDCKAIVEKVLAKGVWQTQGKTPHSTLYAAVIREIAKLGDKARFRKVDRGMFEAAAGTK